MSEKQSKKRTTIGGQAVLEGVMMKGQRSIATAVRAESGDITVESMYIKSTKEKNIFFRFPFVRGVVNLCSQLFLGMGILMKSAEVYGDFAEPTKMEKKIAEKLKINPMNLIMAFSVVIGVVIAVCLFVLLPNFLTGLIFELDGMKSAHPALQSLMEGGFMLTIFVLYVLSVSLVKDVKRVFMYHGAEHKVITCYESGLDLTVENVRKMSKEHSRCGTTFMFFVVAVSILVFALVNWILSLLGWLTDSNIVNAFIKLGTKLLFLPLVAGISYELLKLLSKSDCLLFKILRFPGMMLQKLTTKMPTDDMLEVALVAFNTVLAMDECNTIPVRSFDIKMPYPVARNRIEMASKGADASDIDWLMCDVLGVKRSELSSIERITRVQFQTCERLAKLLVSGKPLQHVLSNTEFYGIKIGVNSNVLIPRPETEVLVEKAIQIVNQNRLTVENVPSDELTEGEPFSTNELENVKNNFDNIQVLDLCTGSGAIAIAIKSNVSANVLATDISDDALLVAKNNALSLNLDIEFIKSDLFESIGDRRFDVILSNPPYIPTQDIQKLNKKVKDFEPMLALDGGVSGLDFYTKIASQFANYLNDEGVMLLEFGINQQDDMLKIFEKHNIEIIKDLEGIDRIALIKKI